MVVTSSPVKVRLPLADAPVSSAVSCDNGAAVVTGRLLMGLFDRFSRIKDPIRGTAQVVSTTRPPDSATSGNCRMHLVVTVPGHQSFAVDDQYIVKVKKWPSPGDTLPIEASQSEPGKFKILWDEVQSWEVAAAQQAQQLAAMMNQPPPPTGQQPPVTPSAGTIGQPVVMVDGRPATPAEIQQYESMTGMDLDGDGRIAGGAAAPSGGLEAMIAGAMAGHGGPVDQPGTADDRVAALERLAALRATGALSDAEFEAEKARILGTP
jgi:hypothetical protein